MPHAYTEAQLVEQSAIGLFLASKTREMPQLIIRE